MLTLKKANWNTSVLLLDLVSKIMMANPFNIYATILEELELVTTYMHSRLSSPVSLLENYY